MKKILMALFLIVSTMMTGCGGGGGGSSTPAAAPTTAVVKLSSQGTLPPGAALAGVGVTLELPAGVTVKSDGGGVPDVSVVVPSGLMGGAGNAVVVAGSLSYTAATATIKAKLNFTLLSNVPGGVGVGEYATLTLNLAGVTPAATEFTVTLFDPIDLLGNHLTVLSSHLALALY